MYFQFWPFVYFSCGWFVDDESPTRRAVLPVLPRRHQRRMWVDWSNKRFNLQGKWLPTEWYYHNIQLLTAGLFFLRLDLCRRSSYAWCVNADENLREVVHDLLAGGEQGEWKVFAVVYESSMGIYIWTLIMACFEHGGISELHRVLFERGYKIGYVWMTRCKEVST